MSTIRISGISYHMDIMNVDIYLRWGSCGWSSSSAGTAAPSSCLSCSGSGVTGCPVGPPAPPGTPYFPAWRCGLGPPDTGAWYGNVSCTVRSGYTSRLPVNSPWGQSSRHSPKQPPHLKEKTQGIQWSSSSLKTVLSQTSAHALYPIRKHIIPRALEWGCKAGTS